VNRPKRKHRLRFLYCMTSSPERTPKKTSPILYCCMTSPERTRKKTPTVALAVAFIHCHSNGCQHMPYCLQHTRHTIFIEIFVLFCSVTQMYVKVICIFTTKCFKACGIKGRSLYLSIWLSPCFISQITQQILLKCCQVNSILCFLQIWLIV
jgi:hypothetical protein